MGILEQSVASVELCLSKSNLKWLKQGTIFITVAGSHAYGTAIEGSDVDLKGIAIPPKEYFLGFSRNFEQAEFKDPDFTIFDIRKFFNLAADANPNVLEVLWTADEDVLLCNFIGKILLENRGLFLSKKVKHTFSGYALSQLKRIEGHRRWLLNPPKAPPTRAEFGLPERTVIPADQLEAARAAIQKQLDKWSFRELEHVDRAVRIAIMNSVAEALAEMKIGSNEQFKAAGRLLNYDENFLELLDRERRYFAKHTEWIQYQNWKATRNPVRAALEASFGYDCYTADTEFLTDTGWKRFEDITTKDKLATIFVNNSGLAMKHRLHLGIEYQQYLDKFEGSYNGPMYNIKGEHLNIMVTPNHRLLICEEERVSKKTGDWKLVEAANLPDTFQFLHTITPRMKTFGTSRNFKDLPISDVAYMRLMGWYLSEGSMDYSKSGKPDNIRISQKKGGKLYSSMVKFSRKHADLPCSLYHYTHDVSETRRVPTLEAVLSIRNSMLCERILSDCGFTDTKRIPRWVFGLSRRFKEILFDSMVLGDGTVRNTSYKSIIYCTSLKLLADDVQELAVSCGWETSIYGPYGPYKDQKIRSVKPKYQVHVNKHVRRTRRLIRSVNVEKKEVRNQRIVCFTVSNGTLVVRRNGHVSFQGNSKHCYHLIRLLRMCREILTTGSVLVKRPDREELLAIRSGQWEYDKIVNWAREEDEKLTDLAKTSVLPDSPDRDKLNQLCMGLASLALDKGVQYL